jgi:hypothetical protein
LIRLSWPTTRPSELDWFALFDSGACSRDFSPMAVFRCHRRSRSRVMIFVLLVSAVDESLTELGSQRVARGGSNVDLLPEQTRDDSGGFDSLDARLLADVPPHHGG